MTEREKYDELAKQLAADWDAATKAAKEGEEKLREFFSRPDKIPDEISASGGE